MLFSLAEIYLISPYFLTIKTLVSSFFFLSKVTKTIQIEGKILHIFSSSNLLCKTGNQKGYRPLRPRTSSAEELKEMRR